MSHPFNDKVEESVYEKGKTDGYEECMKEWLGLLRFHLAGIEMRLDNEDFEHNALAEQDLISSRDYIQKLIEMRWHVEGKGVARGK